MFKISAGAAAICLSVTLASAQADVLLVNENFDSIGASGTAMPAGWVAGRLNPVKNRDNTGGNGAAIVAEALVVDNGGATGGSNGVSYNYGSTGSSDRAIGHVPRTPNGDHITQVAVTNTTGLTLTSFTLSYWGEQWHRGESRAAAQPEKLRVFYSASSSTNGFVRMTAFDFIAPQNNNTLGQAALDGNLPANRALVSGLYTPATPIAPGATFYIRWYDYNDDATLDHGLAIDDVQISVIPEPATLGLLGVAGLLALRRKPRV